LRPSLANVNVEILPLVVFAGQTSGRAAFACAERDCVVV